MTGTYSLIIVFACIMFGQRFIPQSVKERLKSPYGLHSMFQAQCDRIPVWISALSLPMLFALQLRLVATMIERFNPAGYTVPNAPVAFLSEIAFMHARSKAFFDLSWLLLTCLESLMLFALYRGVTQLRHASPTESKKVLSILACAAIALFFFAFSSRVCLSADAYAYISYAKFGLAAYTTPLLTWSGDFMKLSAIDQSAWRSLDPCPYGPVWLAFMHQAVAWTTTLWQAFLVERVLGAFAVVGCSFAIARLTGKPPLAALFVLNPMVLMNYVVEAHLDIFGLLCVLSAAAVFKRSVVATVFLQAFAGLIKLPYMFLMVLATSRSERLSLRLLLPAVAVCIGIGASWLLGGAGYLHGLTYHVAANKQSDTHGMLTHIVLAVLAVATVAAAVFFRRFEAAFAPAFAALAAAAYPWYLAMMLPYIIIGEVAPVSYLASLPMFALFVDPMLNDKLVKIGLVVALCIWAYIAHPSKVSQARTT